MKLISILLTVQLLAAGCSSGQRQGEEGLTGVQSLLWFQYSAEVEALYLQGFNIATELVMNYDFSESKRQPAVTLDLDETVLDNSAFNVQLLREGYVYSEERWAAWCERRAALALPGALEFTLLADSIGVEVFYISNRTEALRGATLDNLTALGFPNADDQHLLLKSSSSSKDERRARVHENHDIILLIGDNLGDFDGIFDDRTDDYGKHTVRVNAQEFGKRFIIMPNPVYGTWVNAVFPQGMPGDEAILDKLRGY